MENFSPPIGVVHYAGSRCRPERQGWGGGGCFVVFEQKEAKADSLLFFEQKITKDTKAGGEEKAGTDLRAVLVNEWWMNRNARARRAGSLEGGVLRVLAVKVFLVTRFESIVP